MFFLQGSVYSAQAPPGYAAYVAPTNQGQYVPQLQQTAPYQGPGAAPQEYAYTAGQVPSSQYQPAELQYPSQQQFAGHYQMQPNYPAAVSGPYTADPHPQLVAAQSRY